MTSHCRRTGASSTHTQVQLKLLTLNCWGLPFFLSKHKSSRIQAIGLFLSGCDYDVVMLQEVWCKADFRSLRRLLKETLPYSHYFCQGIVGTGICVFTRVPIRHASFHTFSVNGYPTAVCHGDWFASKGVACCKIRWHGFNVHLLTSHFHAEYDPDDQTYLAHRIVQSLECSQLLTFLYGGADAIVYGGDFNSEPHSLPYQILNSLGRLQDVWTPDLGGETNQTLENSFTVADCKSKPSRIDYIFYQEGPGVQVKVDQSWLPMPTRVPNQTYSYSDHEAVAATLSLRRQNESDPETRLLSNERQSKCEKILEQAAAQIDAAIMRERGYRVRWLAVALSLVIMFTSLLVMLPLAQGPCGLAQVVCSMLIFTIGLIHLCMATIFSWAQRNALDHAKRLIRALVGSQDY